MMTTDKHYRAIIEAMDEDQAVSFVSARVKEVIEDTRRTRVKVELALDELDDTG